ncbi:hypothetical protein SLEP1_g27619 [Rubroshorea leprosula]|uniref:Uncharacterized protein n=1 Tax=Rubroshorea leprosula TaxID=152421 RepID=A0AAV5K1S1_9ROSI|nr:hypothetical protein SLEP1_g27619 [Rubroshorea leprosula]
MSTCIFVELVHPANGVKHWALLTPWEFVNTGTITDACQWEFVNIGTITNACQWECVNTGTITDACQWEFVKHWP